MKVFYSEAHNYLDTRLNVGAGEPSPYAWAMWYGTVVSECPHIFGFYYNACF